MKGDDSSNVVPLRTILQNFLNLVENYEARRNGGLDHYESEFQELKQFSESLKSDPDYICKEGERSVNRKKNRYKDILPFDYTRVSLSDCSDVPGSDYINANFIKGASGSSAYIACQGPLPHTANSFWRMLVECEVQVIVMACNEQESGKHKCENYWVEEDGVEREFGDVSVWLKKCRHVCPDFLVRTMRIRFTNSRGEKEERNMCQFHYSAWPDHGVPTKVRPLLDMVRLIRDCQTSETLPVLVHCSAGCGRTGTICAIDYVYSLLRLGRLSPDFSLFNLVREMRKQRIAMVQTKDQYILVHRAVKELFQEQLKLIDSHPYANVDVNGLPLEIKKDLEEPTYEILHFTPSSSSSCKDRSTVSHPIPPPPQKNDIVKADNNNIIVSVSNTHTSTSNNVSKPPHVNVNLTSSSSSSSTSTNLAIPLPSRMNKSNVTKLEKEMVDSPQKHKEYVDLNLNSKGNDSLRSNHKIMEQHQPSYSFSDDDKHDKKKSHKDKKMSSSSDDTDTCDRESIKKHHEQSQQQQPQQKSSNGLNPIRSALLRKPSIVKLKSFFEKSPKDDKEKKTPQLSRAKSDVSARFYSFISSRSSPTKTSVTSTSTNSNVNATANDSLGAFSSSSSPPPPLVSSTAGKNDEDLKSKKPAILAKPLNIKRSKSLKVPIQPDSVKTNLTAIISNSKSSNKRLDKHNTSGGSVSSSNPSTSSSGFSNILTDNNPIKVCVKQVEIPKLQAIVSKSVKPEIQKATTTAASIHEYDYDISDGSHLRQKPITSSTMLQLEQSKAKANSQQQSVSVGQDAKLDLGLPSLLQPNSNTSSYSQSRDEEGGSGSRGGSSGTHKPIPPSRIHILKDNHNYVNIAYGNRVKPGMAKEMEDLNVQDNYASSSYGGKYGKLKKCDTVNPRMIAASLGFATPKNERTSLTRSQSHVWQSDKQNNLFSRIFSDENLHQSTAITTAASSHPSTTTTVSFSGAGGREPSSPTKTTINLVSTNGPMNFPNRKSLPSDVGSNFLIQAINADVSVQRYDTTSDILDDNVHLKSEKNSAGGERSLTPTSTSYHSNSNSIINDKPLIRRRVPKTNPYANYPACVTGSNSKFPYNKLQQQPTSSTLMTTMMDESYQMNEGNLTKDNNNIPILKSSYGGSVGTSSSGSSSTTANSLPSTPTQSVSVDVLYPQLHRLCTSSSGRNSSTFNGRSNNGSASGSPFIATTRTKTEALTESDDKLDSSRIYSHTMPLSSTTTTTTMNGSTNIPKIRLAVGVRERRNSFRQAVWKEAATTNTGISNNNSNPVSNSHYESIDNQPSSSSRDVPHPPPYSSAPRIPKNYEPIWPDTSSSPSHNNKSFRQPLVYTSTVANANTPSSLDNRRPLIMSPSQQQQSSKHGNSYAGFPSSNSNSNNKAELNHVGNSSGWLQPQRPNTSSNNTSDQAFQTKVDEIKVMLAELNAPVASGKSLNGKSTSGTETNQSKSHGHGPSNSKVPSLKQQRSLRAPTRSQYQQGLSCFTFKKPSSYESIHQLQNDDDEYEPLVTPLVYKTTDYNSKPNKEEDDLTTRNISRRFQDRDRVSNDYVTLQQCRGSSDNPYEQSGSSRQSSSSPDFPKKGFNSNESNVPIPPPRTKRNHHLNLQNNSTGKGSRNFNTTNDSKHVENTSSTGLSMWSPLTPNTPLAAHNSNGTSDSSSAYLQPKSVENPLSRSLNTNHNLATKSNYLHVDQVNDNHCQDDFNRQVVHEQEQGNTNNINSTSPKAIIRALGLFQAKAANVRSRLANWSEAKDRSNSKRSYENGISNNSSDREGSEEPGGHSSNGFRTSPSPGAAANGPVIRSKHQYL